MSIEEAIRSFTSWSGFYKDSGNMKEAVDNQQIANWLQELKERREKESRGINLAKPYITVQIDTEKMQRAIDEAIDNTYYECKNCGQKMFPQRKEESK